MDRRGIKNLKGDLDMKKIQNQKLIANFKWMKDDLENNEKYFLKGFATRIEFAEVAFTAYKLFAGKIYEAYAMQEIDIEERAAWDDIALETYTIIMRRASKASIS